MEFANAHKSIERITVKHLFVKTHQSDCGPNKFKVNIESIILILQFPCLSINYKNS